MTKRFSLKKMGTMLLIASMISTAMAPAVMAASKKKVGKINLTIDSDIRSGRSGGDVEATATGSNTDLFYVDACEVINDEGDDWSRSNPPEVEITMGVEDEEAYYFSSESSSGFKLTLGSSSKNRFDKVEFVKADRRDSNATLILTVRLVFDKDADTSSATAPSDVEWSSNGYATWGDVSSAKYFQVQLIRNNSSVGDIQSVYSLSHSFASMITEPGTYKFKVRTVKSSNNAKSSWVTSDSWTVSAEDIINLGNTVSPVSSNSGWQRAADGIRWWWSNPDGSYPASAWMQIGGQWYYFDAAGYMATGWVNVNGLSYYLDPVSGAMYANTRTPDGYWVNESGAWVPGV